MPNRSRSDAGSRMEPNACPVPPQLTDEQWSLISDLFPVPTPDPRGGRPRADVRQCLEGILWVLRSGARWKDLPRSLPSYVTCWRRFVEWSMSGLWERAWLRLLNQLDERGAVDWEQSFADGTFASAKKGAISSVPPSGAKAPSSCSWSMDEDCRWPSTWMPPALAKSR
jgi:transposase